MTRLVNCWSSTNRIPTISDSHLHNGTGTGDYDINITGLTPSTTYYVCAYFFSWIRNVVPCPTTEDFTKIFPLWYSSMMRLASDNPRPQPRFLLV